MKIEIFLLSASNQFQTLWSTFETAIKCKNKIIETLLLDLDGAEAQYMLSFKTHSEMIKKLIGKQDFNHFIFPSFSQHTYLLLKTLIASWNS